jgi:hypothetical protein
VADSKGTLRKGKTIISIESVVIELESKANIAIFTVVIMMKNSEVNNVKRNHNPKGKYKIKCGVTRNPDNAKIGLGAAEE